MSDSFDCGTTAPVVTRGVTEDGSRLHPHVREVAATLVDRFGRPTLGNKKNPFNELLYIILSSRTPPDSYQDTYRSLRRRFRTADSLAVASLEEVAEAIELGGLQMKKGRAISAIAVTLKGMFGHVTLAPLRRMETSEAEELLTSLPGVSMKTARCVLTYALGRPVFPVDVHCYRVSQRLGWAPSDGALTRRRADELQAGIPEELRRELHVGMVLLSRYYCRPRTPNCEVCPVTKLCPRKDYGHQNRIPRL